MGLYEKIKTLIMLPKSRSHLRKIMQQLENQSYDTLLQQSYHISKTKVAIDIIVKSYFWASRTIKNCQCLPRSIALYQNLKESGYQVEHKFGVNKQVQYLAAHSWVEFQNKPLNESPDLKQRFKVLEKI